MLRRSFRALVACRYLLFVAIATVRVLQIRARLDGRTPGDWGLFVVLADNFVSRPLHALATVRDLPTGPLMAPLIVPFHNLGSQGGWQGTGVVLMLLSLVVVRMCEVATLRRPGCDPERVRVTGFVGGALLVLAWVGPTFGYAHPDDTLALVALVVAVLACREDRWVATAVAIGVAAAFKPWGIYFLPLALVADPRRFRGPLIALTIAIAPWVPFLLADHHTLDAAHYIIPVTPGSSLRAFGVATHTKESWSRLLQGLVAIAFGAMAVRRGRWWLVVWLGFAVRINLEPGAFGYYAAGPMVGALLADFLRPGRIPAWRTVITWSLLYGVGGLAADVGAGASSLAAIKITARLLVLVLVLIELLRPMRNIQDPSLSIVPGRSM